MYVVRILCLVSICLLFPGSARSADKKIPTTGSYTFNYSNVGQNLYATVITSTFNKFTDCTISWTGTGTDGKPNSGSHGYVLPPYYGQGTAITSRANFNLSYMNATAICSPRN